MNNYQRDMMDKPSMRPGWCVLCGKTPVSGHHVIPRSQGGVGGPVLDLCGSGTTLHHGAAEGRRLHFRYSGGWQVLRTDTATKYDEALRSDKWEPLTEEPIRCL